MYIDLSLHKGEVIHPYSGFSNSKIYLDFSKLVSIISEDEPVFMSSPLSYYYIINFICENNAYISLKFKNEEDRQDFYKILQKEIDKIDKIYKGKGI